MRRRYKAVIIALCCLLVLVTVICVFGLIERLFNKSNTISGGNNDSGLTGEITYNGEVYRKNASVKTMLLMGIDSKDGEDVSHQADFLVMLVMNTKDKSYRLLHINRDTMTEVRELNRYGETVRTFKGQIALAHAYGENEVARCNNAVNSVKKLLYGAPVDYYMSMTMDAVSIINDKVGGITVTVKDDFSAVDPTLKKGETVTLTGEQALTYVRARGGMEEPTNLARMERQKEYLTAFIERLSDLDGDKMVSVMTSAGDYLKYSCSPDQLSQMFTDLKDYTFNGITSLEGEVSVGEFAEYHVNEDSLRRLIVELFYLKK